MKAKPGDLLAFAVLLAGAVLMVAPFLWMISTSLKPAAEQFDMRLIPRRRRWRITQRSSS